MHAAFSESRSKYRKSFLVCPDDLEDTSFMANVIISIFL
jgi:hypothetical protein